MNLKTSLTPLEVSELLKITKNTVYELIKRGELPSYKVGKKIRIDIEDVEEYINSQRNSRKKTNVKSFNQDIHKSYSKDNDNTIIISGQDIILDILARYIEELLPDYKVIRSYKGSYNGLYDLYNNNVSIASCHLWDGDKGQYNLDYVKRLVPGVPCNLINLAYRVQGFYVPKGNPLKLNSFADLLNSNVKFVNREKGSGTRILLDEKLRLLNIDPIKINGYYDEVNSHLSVASKVGRGESNVGLGNKKAAMQVENIDFIPLQTERYDLVIKKSDYTNPIYTKILTILTGENFKNELIGLGGYDLRDLGKIVAYT